jgi:uncharacterized protein YpmS
LSGTSGLGAGSFFLGLACGVLLVLVAGLAFGALNKQGPGLAVAPPSGNAPVTVTLDESAINSQLKNMLPPDSGISDATVKLQEPNQAMVEVQTKLLGIPVSPEATVQFALDEGAIRIKVMNVDLGGLTIPYGSLLERISGLEKTAEEQLNQEMARALAGTGLQVQRVSVSDSTLVVEAGGK